MNQLFSVLLFIFIGLSCNRFSSESVFVDNSSIQTHCRGLKISSFDESLVAISAKNGVCGLFDLNNITWLYIDSLFGFEDFRDVEILQDTTLILLNSGNKGLIHQVKSDDRGQTVFKMDSLFLDGFSFYPFNSDFGFAYGDPMDSNFVVLKTENSGQSWTKISATVLPNILLNEAGFAASGTGIQTPSDGVIFIATGLADTARIFRSFTDGYHWDVVNTPMKSGGSYGIYSMYFSSARVGFIVGGSYKDSLYNDKICYYTSDRGETWQNRSKGLPGYLSCVCMNRNESLTVVTGRLGTYYSLNKGKKWKMLTKQPYYSCTISDSKIILSGKRGRFEIFEYYLK